MNLVIDVGNQRTKYALFLKGELVSHEALPTQEITELLSMVSNQNVQQSIISDVSGSVEPFVFELKKLCPTIVLDHNTPISIKNSYKTPETLGRDRLAAVIGASNLYPKTDLLVIDAGTSITYDFISADAQYYGGGISLGIAMRFKALNHFTGGLPLVDPAPIEYLIGQTTEESIRSGVLNGVVEEVKGVINRYQAKYPQLKTVLTGGDADFFDTNIKYPIFAIPNLVLFGLNKILIHNAELR